MEKRPSFNSKSRLITRLDNEDSRTDRRILIVVVTIAIVVIVALAVEVAILSNDGDSTNDSKTQTQKIVFTGPECLQQYVNPTDLDRANCILESYPLIDGYV